MQDSYPFPVYSGIFEPKHYKQIGAALWFFLWCIKSVTEESEDEEGVTWGHVYRGAPIKLPDLAEPFGTNEKTVRRWIETLEEYGYLKVTRAPYGIILAVRNSKKKQKRSDRNVQSDERERTEMSNLTDKNVQSNKDIIKTFTTSTTTGSNQLIELINAFCPLHNKMEFHLVDKERRLMIKMIGQGIPSPFIIRVMNQVHRERSGETKITSFLYYESPIYEAWKTEQAITEGVPISPVAIGAHPITDRVPTPAVAIGKQTFQERRNEIAKRKIREAEERERSGSQEIILRANQHL